MRRAGEAAKVLCLPRTRVTDGPDSGTVSVLCTHSASQPGQIVSTQCVRSEMNPGSAVSALSTQNSRRRVRCAGSPEGHPGLRVSAQARNERGRSRRIISQTAPGWGKLLLAAMSVIETYLSNVGSCPTSPACFYGVAAWLFRCSAAKLPCCGG